MIALVCTIIASASAIYITERLVRLFRKPVPEPIFVPEPVREEAKPDPTPAPQEYVSPKERFRLSRKPHKTVAVVPAPHNPKKPASDLAFGNIRSEFSPPIGIRR